MKTAVDSGPFGGKQFEERSRDRQCLKDVGRDWIRS